MAEDKTPKSSKKDECDENKKISSSTIQKFLEESTAYSENFTDKSQSKVIAEREDEYHAKRLLRKLSPPRKDPFEDINTKLVTGSKKKRSRWDQKEPEKMEQDNTKKTKLDQDTLIADSLAKAGLSSEQISSIPIIPDNYDERNRPLSTEELDRLLPSNGYIIVEPPENYKTLEPNNLYSIPIERPKEAYGIAIPNSMISGDLPPMKAQDIQYFSPLLIQNDDLSTSTKDDKKSREILELLLRIKNGDPSQRKLSLKLLIENARRYGPALLFNHLLPLLMSPSLEDQERHLMVKVIGRLLYKLDDLVRPYVHKILVVIEPLLIETNYFARVEGREIISNLAKAAGLPTMIATLRPDIDSADEHVRNVTARAFSVVATALGIDSILLFLKAVCKSKKSWEARHTGIKIVQQIAILVGPGVLPYLKSLVEIIQDGLDDEQSGVKTITALTLSALAEASAPYGIECFDFVLEPLLIGLKKHRDKMLAAYLKAVGFIIPLMEPKHATYYTKEIMDKLVGERGAIESNKDEIKKIVLQVIQLSATIPGISAEYLKANVLPKFFKHFWTSPRTALGDRRTSKILVDTTVRIAQKTGGAEIISKIVDILKDKSEPFRKMAVLAIDNILSIGSADISPEMVKILIDRILFAFCEQTADDSVVLNGFGTIVNSFGIRCKPYLPTIAEVIKFRLNNKNPKTRQQAADLISRIAPVMHQYDEQPFLNHLGVVLYEYLGEEYPEVLGSILGALKAIVNVTEMDSITPPIKDLLPRLTPIMKNRHEKVQENCIELVGRIAHRGAEYVGQREWMRICFELLELLNAHKKNIRKASVNTFGYIAKAIGPHDVLNTLLNNLRVQERQNRVCTCVAIGIVAENCGPFTVLPALLNEYRIPDCNVQNGVLKSLSFIFEYIGESARDYAYSVCSVLTDALMDRDLVHRQTASTVIQHLGMDVFGLGCEDLLIHLLNYIWPNILETSPHVINAVTGAIDAIRVSAGPGVIMCYLLQGLFHPSRKVRQIYWKIYNSMYIGSQDPLVAFYPRFTEDLYSLSPESVYNRPELQLFI